MFSSDQEGHCGFCHAEDSEAYLIGQKIRGLLETAEDDVEQMEKRLADIAGSGRNLSDMQTLTEEARTLLTEVLPITHTLSVDRVAEKTARVAKNAETLLEEVNVFEAELRARKRNLGIILGVILVNTGALWIKRRSLNRS